MRKFFSSLSFKIGSMLILTEIVILAVVGAIYTSRFSDQIDKRIEDRVRLPGVLVNSGLVRVIAIRDADSLRLLVGEEIEDAILIDAERLTSTYSLSGQFDGQHIDEIPGFESAWFDLDNPQEVLTRTEEEGEQFMVGITPITDARGATDSFLYVKTSLKKTEDEKRNLEQLLLLGSLGTVLATFFVIFLSFRFMVFTRIANVVTVLRQLEEGDLSARVETTISRDEIGVLQRGMNAMADRRERAEQALKQLNEELEDRVSARTHELEIASDVSRQITTVLDIDTLLEQVATLTCQGFDLYSSTIFLINSEQQTLDSAAGVALDHDKKATRTGSWSIALDATPSIVAKAGRTRDVVLVNDVASDELYLHNPTFLETQAEIAIPMMIGSSLLGVFDLQSRQINKFGADDVRVLTSLAEQIAIAIRNAQLFATAQSARDAAEQANTVKSQFLAAMSHELRTPLNAILNLTKLVSEGVFGDVNDEQINMLTRVVGSGQHLLSLINDLLDISKIESGSLQLFVEENVDLRPELENIAATAKTLLENKPVDLILEIDEGLPLIIGDKRRIHQIILNLVSNACKFTKKGSISIRASQQNSDIKLSVQDTGPGIAPEEQDAVFEIFTQTSAGLQQGGGTGLGMPISRRLAEAHEGHLWLESAVGEGTTFHVVLPIRSEKMLQLVQEKRAK